MNKFNFCALSKQECSQTPVNGWLASPTPPLRTQKRVETVHNPGKVHTSLDSHPEQTTFSRWTSTEHHMEPKQGEEKKPGLENTRPKGQLALYNVYINSTQCQINNNIHSYTSVYWISLYDLFSLIWHTKHVNILVFHRNYHYFCLHFTLRSVFIIYTTPNKWLIYETHF